MFSYYFDLVLRHQLGHSLVWRITVIGFTVLIIFRFLGPRPDGTVGFTFHDGGMCRYGQGFLGRLALKFCKHFDYICFSWFLEGSFFDAVRSVVAMQRSAEANWTGLG